MSDRITYLASTDARGKVVPFGIKEMDRAKHIYIIGKTGMGKSTLLENMAIQDVQSGQGLAFIDPHGGTAEKILDYIPEDRIKDVLYFAPFDTDNPVAFNVMEDIGADKRHLVVSGLMATFKKIWVDAWSGRMEYILSNTILALLEYPNSTLLGVNRMLSDADYRDVVISHVKDSAVRAFWTDEFANYGEKYMQEAGDAIKNKVGQFTSNPLIRNIIGQPKSTFNIREMMDKKKIIIMNLSKGRVGETNMALLGSMLTTRLYIGAMSRADATNLKELPPFFFYVDEFQNFANDTFSDILSEARKYKLNLTIANQYVEQMDEKVRAAVFGNVGTTIAFRVGPFDAETLETVFMPKFTKEDLVNLGFTQVYMTLQIDGVGSPPFSARTLGPIAAPRVSHKERVMIHSAEVFGRPRAIVEKEINDWYKPVEAPEGFTIQKGKAKKKKPDGYVPRPPQGNGPTYTPRPPQPFTPSNPPPPQGDRPPRPPRDDQQPSQSQRPHLPQQLRPGGGGGGDRPKHFTPRPQTSPTPHMQQRPHSQQPLRDIPKEGPHTAPSLSDLRATLKALSDKQKAAPPQSAQPHLRSVIRQVAPSAQQAAEPATPPPQTTKADTQHDRQEKREVTEDELRKILNGE